MCGKNIKQRKTMLLYLGDCYSQYKENAIEQGYENI